MHNGDGDARANKCKPHALLPARPALRKIIIISMIANKLQFIIIMTMQNYIPTFLGQMVYNTHVAFRRRNDEMCTSYWCVYIETKITS